MGHDSARRNKGGGSKPKIDGNAQAVFLTQLRRGARHADAAREAGFARSSFYRLRGRDAVFARLWDDAVAHSSGLRYVCPGKGRALQLRRNRRVTFTEGRKKIFLEHFAGTCNLAAAAEAAGVSEKTVLKHRAKDPQFAANFQAELEQCYARLEAYMLQRRLEAQVHLQKIEPKGELEPEFERALKLMQRWERRNGALGLRSVAPGRQRRWTFDEAIELLERKLRNMDVPIPPPVPEDEP